MRRDRHGPVSREPDRPERVVGPKARVAGASPSFVESRVLATDPTIDGRDGTSSEGADDEGALFSKAERCRRLAAGISDRQAADVLTSMARNYQAAAERLGGQD